MENQTQEEIRECALVSIAAEMARTRVRVMSADEDWGISAAERGMSGWQHAQDMRSYYWTKMVKALDLLPLEEQDKLISQFNRGEPVEPLDV